MKAAQRAMNDHSIADADSILEQANETFHELIAMEIDDAIQRKDSTSLAEYARLNFKVD